MNSIYTEYANLTDEHKSWLDRCGATWACGKKFLHYEDVSHYIVFNGGFYKQFTTCHPNHLNNTYTHIPTGDEFCQRVAEILGIDKPTFGNGIKWKDGSYTQDEMDKLFPGRQNMGEGSLTQEDIEFLLDQKPDELKTGKAQPSYPHKTYRVLDSLDGIPLDTRIPLSEWIPPIGKEVLLITDSYFARAKFNWITTKPIFQTPFSEHGVEVDGHWMRIL